MDARAARALAVCVVALSGVLVGSTLAAAGSASGGSVGVGGESSTESLVAFAQDDGTDEGSDDGAGDAEDGGANDGTDPSAETNDSPDPSAATNDSTDPSAETNDSTGPSSGRTNASGGGSDRDNGAADQDDGGNNATVENYDEVGVGIHLQGNNGSATWTVEYRYRLADNESAETWDRLRADVADRPDAYVDAFEERWSEEVAQAENETDREMDLSNVAVTTENESVPQEYGFVTFTFEWSSFALVEVNRIEAGDALAGFVMDDRTRLMVTWPEEYNVTTIEPEPDERREQTTIWRGDQSEFVEGEPRVELIQTGGGPVSTPGGGEERTAPSWLPAVGAAVVLVVGAIGWWVRRDGTASGAEAGGSGGAVETAGDDAPPPDLLSNEERVLRLLEDHDGRIKQQEVVSELGWTEAKTSQVVGGLREDDEIEVFRIGRENVLTVPDDETDGS